MFDQLFRAITCSPTNSHSGEVEIEKINHSPLLRRWHYKYQAAIENGIRLLILNPGHLNDTLSATLVHNSLDDLQHLSYETVSYAWGDASLRSCLQIDNVILDIPASASAVLHQVRLRHKPRKLWIDAICINQADLRERQQQVACMRYIYSNSTRNLIYLGPSDNHTEAALTTVGTILADLTSHVQSYSKLQGLLYDSDGSPTIEGGPSKASPYDNEALQSLHDRPWFSRLWVIQEAALAPRDVCLWGKYQLPLFNLLRAAVWYRYKNYRFEIIRDKSFVKAARFYDAVYYGATSRPFSSSREQRSLASYLDLSRHFESSVDSDKVFAMLGLLDTRTKYNDFWKLLTPDYHKPAGLVFKDAFRAALLQDQMLQRPLSLNVVHHWDQSDIDGKDLHSWVPDLRHKGDCTQEAFDFSSHLRVGSIYTNYKRHDISPNPSNTLILHGIMVDTVASVGPVRPFGSTWLQDLEFVEMSADVAQVKALDDEESERTRNFARTLVAGVDVQKSLQTPATISAAFVGWYSWLRSVLMLDSCRTSPAGITQDFASALSQACHMRRLFRTRQGDLGLGPKVTRAGDKAVFLYGCHVTSILRPMLEEKQYHFVGQCYIDGMTDSDFAVRHHTETDHYTLT